MGKLIFMGTSDFACRCLEGLVQHGINTDLVITRPDSVSGRNRRPSMPPMKKLANALGIEVWQPKNINSPESISRLKELAPELMIVVAYGKILGSQVLETPPLGCVNVHASLLPRLRGAAPIEWAIMRGYTETGITTMFMDEGLDTGDIILQQSTPIGPEENAGQLRERLATMAQDLLPETVRQIYAAKAPRISQRAEASDYAPTLDSNLERISWSKTSAEIANHIRALAPKPAAYCMFRGKRLKLLAARKREGCGEPGVATLVSKTLCVGTKEGLLELVEVQPEGKKILSALDFANGYRVQEGELFL